jgi:glycosyltransferase involved in cell wall biosynthesis
MLTIGNFLYHYPEPGGTTTAVEGLSRALGRLGHRVVIYGYGDDPGHVRERAENPAVFLFHKNGRNPFHLSPELRTRLCRNEDRLDLLLVHGIFNPPNVAVGRTAREAGIPYVVCTHGIYHRELFRKNFWRKLAYGLACERPLMTGALGVQALSIEAANVLKRYRIRVPLLVMPNGFDPDEAPRIHPARCASSRLELLYLGRIDMHHKGLDLLMEAVSVGIREGKLPGTLRLQLVGPDWGDHARLKALAARLGIAPNAHFAGRVHGDERWRMITSCDVLVLPSRYDGFGLSALDAMIAARPVLVSDAAGVSCWVRQACCGFVIEPTVESICEGLVRALESRDQWQSMGERGRTFAFANLTWDKIAQQASESYQQLLSRGRRQPETQSEGQTWAW